MCLTSVKAMSGLPILNLSKTLSLSYHFDHIHFANKKTKDSESVKNLLKVQ